MSKTAVELLETSKKNEKKAIGRAFFFSLVPADDRTTNEITVVCKARALNNSSKSYSQVQTKGIGTNAMLTHARFGPI